MQAAAAPPDVQRVDATKTKYQHAINEIEKHLSASSDGTIVLSVKDPAEINVEPDVFDELSKSLGKVNNLLHTGQLHGSHVGLKTDFGASAALVEPRMTAAGSCAGTDQTFIYWWGAKVDFNECATQEIIAGMQAGTGIAAIVALIFGATGVGVLTAVIGALLALGQGVIQYYDQVCGHRGVAIYFTWFSVIPWAGCP
jgi:hypothetical protein